jgi:hypothetical protein
MTNKPITGIAAMLSLLALAPLLAACNESSAKDQASQAQPAFSQEARTAAEARLRSELRGDVAFRQVGSFTQAAADTVAVCGQLALNGGPDTGFVALVSRQQDGSLTVEPHVATDNVSATRVFVETRSRCVADAAAMPASRRGAPPPLPVIPATLATVTPAAPAAVVRMETEAAQVQQAQAGVMLRQNGNLREHPNGGGTVLRVVPRGSALRVFAEAPGGWLQVGQQQAEGWVHSSMVTRGEAPAPTLTTASR